METKYGHEWRHEIGVEERSAIRKRLGAVARKGPCAPGGRYLVRSLDFNRPKDGAFSEKTGNKGECEAFGIRYFNGNTRLIRLEKKCRMSGMYAKFETPLSAEEAEAITEGMTGWMAESDRPLVRELYVKMRDEGLRPVSITDYTRESYVYGPGNVYVTIDYDIRSGLCETDFLNPESVTIFAAEAPGILEVRWDDFLPDIIRDAVHMKERRFLFFSGFGEFGMCG